MLHIVDKNSFISCSKGMLLGLDYFCVCVRVRTSMCIELSCILGEESMQNNNVIILHHE